MAGDSKFKSGAVRSAAVAHLSFTSLPPVGLLALARTAGEGATKYGRFNYMLGMPIHDLLDHTMAHIVNYIAGDRSEPHLAHAAWGLLVAVQSEVLDPDLSAPHMLGPGATVTQAMKDYLAEQAPILAARRKSGELDGLGNWSASGLPEVLLILAQRSEARFNEENAPRETSIEQDLRQAFAVAGITDEDIQVPIPVPCADCGEVHDPVLDHEGGAESWDGWADDTVSMVA
jgi:hypothetical protein